MNISASTFPSYHPVVANHFTFPAAIFGSGSNNDSICNAGGNNSKNNVKGHHQQSTSGVCSDPATLGGIAANSSIPKQQNNMEISCVGGLVGVTTASSDFSPFVQPKLEFNAASFAQTSICSSANNSSSNSSGGSSGSGGGVRKQEDRLLRNRSAAKECRLKKKEYVRCLEKRLRVLEDQNKQLIEQVKTLMQIIRSTSALAAAASTANPVAVANSLLIPASFSSSSNGQHKIEANNGESSARISKITCNHHRNH